MILDYFPVMKHSNGKSPIYINIYIYVYIYTYIYIYIGGLVRKSSKSGAFSIARVDYRRVPFYLCVGLCDLSMVIDRGTTMNYDWSIFYSYC